MKQKQRANYDIFNTRWGWFGVLAYDGQLVRTRLADTEKEAVKNRLLQGIDGAERNKNAFLILKMRILDYYNGRPVDFDDVKVRLAALTPFQRDALTALRAVRYGQTITYIQLARMAGRPKAARAVGSVMAVNPLPLIIPCHRVIKSDGAIGHFSAFGGTNTKKRMLELEKRGR